MPVTLKLLLTITLAFYLGVCSLLAPAARAAEDARDGCLTKAEQREAVAAKKAIPLALAIKSLHDKRIDVVRARLCRRGDGLVYVLTLLARNGKVTAESIDAMTGASIGAR